MAICATLICASFTACSNSETDILSTEETKVPLTISATIQSSTETRKAGYDATYFETGDEIGLYILSVTDYESAYSSESTCYNVRATYNGSSWTLDNDIYLNDEDAYVIAYYPYNESFGSSSLPEDDNFLPFDLAPTDNEQIDVLTSAGVTVNSDNPQAKLVFSHVLTRVILSIGLSDEIESASLTSAAISSKVNSMTCLYLYEGLFYTYYSYGSKEEYLTLSLDETLSATERTNVDFLISSESKTTLTAQLVIDGTSYSVELTTDEWTAGCQYTYPINVKKTENEDDSDDGDSDDGEEEETDGVTYVNGYEAIDLGLSVRWATVNIGAESPEDYGNYYAWGETETKESYTSSNSVTYGVEMDDISGDAEYDAATANWGSKWRMPTKEEFEELLEKCSWVWTSRNGFTGFLVTGPNTNSIFLPAAGYRYGTSLSNDGGCGYYWSSTPSSSDTNLAYYLSFSDSSNHHVSRNGRYVGHTVRPVSE